jgi:23S rRNA-/tRNA-specific pseudouridylate synthase
VHAHEDYVVVNKPPGVPVVPPVDNILESCLACTAQVQLAPCVLMCEAFPTSCLPCF